MYNFFARAAISAAAAALLAGPAAGQPVRLAGPAEGAQRVAIAEVDGRALAAWVRADGRIGARLGHRASAAWSVPPVDGRVRALAGSSLALASAAGRFWALYVGGGPALHAVSCDQRGSQWSAPQRLGPASGPGSRLSLTGGAGSLLAAWEGTGDSKLWVAWGDAASGTWKPGTPIEGVDARKVEPAGALAGDRALVAWTDSTPALMAVRCRGPGLPWSGPERLPVEIEGTEPESLALAATGARLHFFWSERHWAGGRFLRHVSSDLSGAGFGAVSAPGGPAKAGRRSAAVAQDERVWAAWEDRSELKLSLASSRDGARSWSRPADFASWQGKHTKPPALAAGVAGPALLLWADEAGAVWVQRVP